MALYVSSAFAQFFDNINLPGDHHEIARSRRDNVVSIMKGDFTILDSMTIGSIPKFTAVKGEADLDIMIVLHYGNHIKDKKPSQVLSAVRKTLSNYRTELRRNGQAVTLYYQTWPNVDIVPVAQNTSGGQLNHYLVPDMTSEQWLPSRPDIHAQKLTDRNGSFGIEFKKIIKMIKWWNKQHSDYMESYHIEVIAHKAFETKFDSFSWDLFRYFSIAAELAASPLWYEWSYADQYLQDRPTWRPEVVMRLERARDKARDAWYATYQANNDHARAIGLWRQIFGEKFPAYG